MLPMHIANKPGVIAGPLASRNPCWDTCALEGCLAYMLVLLPALYA